MMNRNQTVKKATGVVPGLNNVDQLDQKKQTTQERENLLLEGKLIVAKEEETQKDDTLDQAEALL